MCRVQYRLREHKQQYETVQYRQTDNTQQCVQFRTDRQTSLKIIYRSVPTDIQMTALFTFQYRKTDETQQFAQCSTVRGTTHTNVYNSVRTDKPHIAKCSVKYRQPDQTLQYVPFNIDIKTTYVNVYSSVQTERLTQQCVEIGNNMQTTNSCVYSSVS